MLIPIKHEKTCNRCGQPIAFRQNRHGQWYAVDVYAVDGELVARSRGWHVCPEQQAEPPANAPQAATARQREWRRRVLEVCATGISADQVQEIISKEFPEFA